MKKTTLALALIWMSVLANAQVKNSFKFDFGTTTAAKGYTAVTASTLYTDAAGYGFISTDDLTAVSRNKKNSISADFISSTKPFFFSVKILEKCYLRYNSMSDVHY